MDNIISLNNLLPIEAQKKLAQQAKESRLARGWKRETLSQQTGIPVPTIKRYETTGEISLRQFLKLAFILGDLDKLNEVFKPDEPFYSSLDEIQKTKEKPKRVRGSK